VAGALTGTRQLVGDITATSSITASAVDGISTYGEIGATSSLAGGLTSNQDRPCVGEVTATVAVEGALSIDEQMVGAVTASSEIAGVLTSESAAVAQELVGAVTATSRLRVR